MANELLTPGVAASFGAVSALGIGYSSRRMRQTRDDSKIPLMGVMGAFVFAAQMVNFQMLPGASGHLGGGVLLAILLGPAAASLVMASILIVQCLVFNDGGLLALGANIFNMGILPCYLGYGMYRLLRGGGKNISSGRLYLACFVATFFGMLGGAAMVPVQVALSGVSAVPFGKFFSVMMGVHIIIAVIEALISFAVILFIHKMRPSLLVSETGERIEGGVSIPAVAGTLLVVTVVTGAFLSLVASDLPDGLEYALGERAQAQTPVQEEHGVPDKGVIDVSKVPRGVAAVTEFQDSHAPLPDYSKRVPEGQEASRGWTSFAGILGSFTVLALMYALAMLTRRRGNSTPATQG